MLKLMFYLGPGDLVTKIIRLVTDGPYSHVELVFSNGCRFFSSGHGTYKGVNLICDHKTYDKWWDRVKVAATPAEEQETQRFALLLVGLPFDWHGLWSFLLPSWSRLPNGAGRRARYCSSVVLEVLQNRMHLFRDHSLQISPNNLYRLFRPPLAEVDMSELDTERTTRPQRLFSIYLPH